jgi:hypothetical protein
MVPTRFSSPKRSFSNQTSRSCRRSFQAPAGKLWRLPPFEIWMGIVFTVFSDSSRRDPNTLE